MKKTKAVLCEVYARVVGYYRPTLNYNIGKKQEWSERKLIFPSKTITFSQTSL